METTELKKVEIKLLEQVINGTLSTNDILRRLLFLYGVNERYFYHFSYLSPKGNYNVNTDELIECTKDCYIRLKSNKKDSEDHKPVKYMSNNIPTDKKLRSILFTR